MSSKVESIKSLKDNPEGHETEKTRAKVKATNQKLNTLKKDQVKLKNKL